MGPGHRVRRDRGPVGAPARRRLHPHPADGHRARATSCSASRRACRSPWTDGRSALPELIAEVAPVVGSYGWGGSTWWRTAGSGIKSRETYECPAALALLLAHSDLEDLTLERDVAHEKARLEPRWAELVYDGMWFSPLKEALDAFFVEHAAPRHRRGAPGARPPGEPARSPAGAARCRSTTTASPPTTPATPSTTTTPRGSCACGASALGHVGGAPGRPRRARSDAPAGGVVTLWEGRLGGDAPTRSMAFTVSLPFDRRLAADDLAGLGAHVRGLARGRGPRRRRGGRSSLAALDRVEEELASGIFVFQRRRRGHPHRRRAPGHRARRRRRGQAPHRAQPQRPGRHRPAPVHAARAAGGGRRRASSSRTILLHRAVEAGDAYLPGLHPPPAGPAGPARPPPPGPRLGAGPRRRPAAAHASVRMDVCPLGAGALAGSSLPARSRRRGRGARVRRAASRTRSTPCRDRDFVAEALFDLALLGRAPVAARRGGRAVVERGVRLLRPRRRLRHGQLDAPPEEEPRRGRAGPGQGGPADRPPGRDAGHAQGAAARLQPRPPGGQGAPLRRRSTRSSVGPARR